MANDNSFISIENKIDKSIKDYKRGKIFFPSNFSKYGSSSAVRQALGRLEDKGILIRIAHGIYLYPKRHESLGVLHPTLEEIATAIAKRDRARIIPTGVQAMNKLGLTTQVPLKAVYLTDGSPRSIQIGKRSIKFKKASPKILAVKNELLALIFLALGEIGQNNIDANITSTLKKLIHNVDEEELRHDLKLAPQWISDFVKKLANE